MTEHLKNMSESQERHEQHEQYRRAELQPNAEGSQENGTDDEAERLKAIQKAVEREATSARETPVEQRQPAAPSQFGVNKELRQAAFDRLIARTRKHLSLPDRLLSNAIHQPAVDTVSRGAEKTVARPLPLLSAGLFAFFGSSIVLYMAKHYGFSYNLGIFVALFVVGFAVGLLVDLIKLALARRRTV